MEYFNQYNSNTLAGSGNQLYFTIPEDEVRTGRIFYKITEQGEYNYSILFSNIIDSTYSDGSISQKNLKCSSWKIHNAKIGRCARFDTGKAVTELIMDADVEVVDLTSITFDGRSDKTVMPGEFFSSDPVKMNFEKDDFLCIEMTFSGEMIPYHEESLLPVFVKDESGWRYSKQMPFAGMIGCDRTVKGRIAFIGDSITQGIGTELNSYMHWNAVLSKKLSGEYAYWNLGIGYGRANDAASDGAWLYKARQNDIVFVCYGVNDILQGFSEEQIKSDLTTIVTKLKESGIKVVLQTVPPFDYEGEKLQIWKRINLYIKEVLKDRVDIIFDNVPILGKNEEMPQTAIYGGHPNAEGCALWAEALYVAVKDFIK